MISMRVQYYVINFYDEKLYTIQAQCEFFSFYFTQFGPGTRLNGL